MGKKKFPADLFNIINNRKYNHIICWSDDGKNIIIKDKLQLTKILDSMKAKSKSESKSESDSETESESGSKSESISKAKGDIKSFSKVHRQLNKYGFHKEISDNKEEDKFSLEGFYRGQDEKKIEQLRHKDINQILQEIKNCNNVEEKIDNYLVRLEDSKNKINQDLLHDILEFLVERKEQRKNTSEEIQKLKKLYENNKPKKSV